MRMVTLGIFAIIAAVVGIVGSIVPGLPGPPISWVGILLLYFAHLANINMLIIWGVVMVVVSLVDYFAPMWLTRVTGGHKEASRGALIGLILGIFLTPIGMISGAFIGAFIGELTVNKDGAGAALKASLGAFLGFILGTGIKLIASGSMAYLIVKLVFLTPAP